MQASSGAKRRNRGAPAGKGHTTTSWRRERRPTFPVCCSQDRGPSTHGRELVSAPLHILPACGLERKNARQAQSHPAKQRISEKTLWSAQTDTRQLSARTLWIWSPCRAAGMLPFQPGTTRLCPLHFLPADYDFKAVRGIHGMSTVRTSRPDPHLLPLPPALPLSRGIIRRVLAVPDSTARQPEN